MEKKVYDGTHDLLESAKMTHRAVLCCLTVMLSASLTYAADADSSTIYELAQVDGVRVGSRIIKTSKQGEMGKQLLTTATLDLTLRRYGSLVRLRREEGCVETAEGLVLGVCLHEGAAGGKQLTIVGKLEEGRMFVQVDDRARRQLVWNKNVVGLRSMDMMWAAKKPKPGDSFRFQRYEPTYNTLLKVKVEVKNLEKVDVLGTKQALLRRNDSRSTHRPRNSYHGAAKHRLARRCVHRHPTTVRTRWSGNRRFDPNK